MNYGYGKPKKTKKRKVQLLLVWVCVLVMNASQTYAASWLGKGSASVTGEYNDNKRLITQQKNDVYGVIANVQFDLIAASPSTKFKLSPRLRFSRYAGDDFLDSNDQFLKLNFDYTTEKTFTSLGMDFSRDTTLTSELEDTGFVQQNKRRLQLNLIPSWTYSLSELSSIKFGYSFQAVKYEDAELTPLVDYFYHRTDATYFSYFSEYLHVNASLYGSLYDAEKLANQTSDYGFQVNFKYNATEKYTYTLNLGAHRSDIKVETRDGIFKDTDTGTLLGVGFNRRFEKALLEFGINQTVKPSSIGSLVRRERVILSTNYKYSEIADFNFSISGTHSKAILDASENKEWNYADFTLRNRWRLAEMWFFSVQYKFRWQKYTSEESDAKSNSILFTLSNSGNRLF